MRFRLTDTKILEVDSDAEKSTIDLSIIDVTFKGEATGDDAFVFGVDLENMRHVVRALGSIIMATETAARTHGKGKA